MVVLWFLDGLVVLGVGALAGMARFSVKLGELLAEKEAAEQALEEKMERWEYLEELAAKIAEQ